MVRDTAWVTVEVKHTTDKAVLVSDSKTEAWLPKSMILDQDDALVKGNTVEIEISQELAEDKGLS